MSPPKVVDYAWQHPNPPSIKVAGYVGVLRYLSYDDSKDISPAERDALFGAGLGIYGLVWETTTDEATKGAQAGAADAQTANTKADAIGYPANLPLYYAVDEDTSWASVAPYFQGAVNHGGRPVAPYGSDAVIDGFAAVYGSTGWQTEAWSGTRVSPHARLYQRVQPTGPPIAGAAGKYDENVVLISTPDPWTGAPQPAPQPAPPPPPAPPAPPPNTYAWRASHNTFTPVGVDGAFGPASARALQYVIGAQVDGLWGPGSVRALQAMLGITQDGVQGPQTVRALQARVGVAQDGSWGPATTRAVQTHLNSGTLS